MHTLYLLEPKTEVCQQWLDENVNVPDYMRIGGRIAVETRYIGDIVEGMLIDGLENQIDFEVIGCQG